MPQNEHRSAEARWLAENRDWLEKTYPGKWIAVQGSELIAVGDSALEVMTLSRAKGVDLPLLDVVRSLTAQSSIVIRTAHVWR